MSPINQVPEESRVLILAPTGRDAPMTRALLEDAGFAVRVCGSPADLPQEIACGAAALLVAEEGLANGGDAVLLDALSGQPAWSDLPLIFLTLTGADSPLVSRITLQYGNVALLERPVRVAALLTSVRSALRSRTRQYQLRADLQEREEVAQMLKEADRRKDEFLAVLAHELRNPLAPIRNSLHILRLTRAGDPAVERAGDIMARQVDHMVRLVDDLLEVSRITRGKIDLHPELVTVSEVLQNAAETSRPLIEAAHHELSVAVPDEPIYVEADPVRLSQVFTNLLNNAAKYMEEGGHIRVSAMRRDGEVTVLVEDEGFGISAELLPRVFDLFTQGDRPASARRGGLGIGLTLAESLVKMHGGRIEARSTGAGNGSQFVVVLPVAPEPAKQPADPPESRSPGSLATRHVLVVDDNRDAADSLVLLLELMGVDASVAYGGSEALEMIGRFQPGMVLLDLGMPGMDGYEVARRIRKQPELSRLRLVALTGWGQEKDRRRSQSAGFDFHLVKPVTRRALETLLGSWEEAVSAPALG